MAYVEAHAGLRDHLKTKKVARLLGIPKVQVIGHMLCLWWWCQEYAQDGDLSNFDAADIAEAAEYEGDPQTFVDALLNCGVKGGAGFLWRDSINNALIVNDWYQYGGKLFVQRAQSAERMRKMRERNGNKTDGYADVTRNEAVTVTHVTPIDKIREDKIRIEDINTSAPVGAKPPKPPSSAQADMFGAICETCELDPKLKQGMIAKTAQSLLAAKYTPEDVRGFKPWWLSDPWRAEHTPVPTVAKLTTYLQQYRNDMNGKPRAIPATNGNGYNTNGRGTSKVERNMAAVDAVFDMLEQKGVQVGGN